MRWVLPVSAVLLAAAPTPAQAPPIPQDLRSLACEVTYGRTREAKDLKG